MKLLHALLAGGLFLTAMPAAAQPRGGAGVTVQPDDQRELQWAAGVTKITDLPQARSEARMFGVTGGDPAMNGLQTYIAFFESPADGFKIFRIGDFLDYAVLSQAPGRVVLSVRENYMPSGNDRISVRWRRLTISWRAPANDQPPASISIAAVPSR